MRNPTGVQSGVLLMSTFSLRVTEADLLGFVLGIILGCRWLDSEQRILESRRFGRED